MIQPSTRPATRRKPAGLRAPTITSGPPSRTGGGPTLVEAKCYRFLSHTTDDDDRTYRTREEIEKHRSLDPIPNYEGFLLEHGVIAPEEIEALKKDVLREVNEITDRAEALPYPEPSQLYVNVYEGTHEPWL